MSSGFLGTVRGERVPAGSSGHPLADAPASPWPRQAMLRWAGGHYVPGSWAALPLPCLPWYCGMPGLGLPFPT